MVIHCTEKFYNAERKYQDYFDLFPYPLSDFQKVGNLCDFKWTS